RYEGAEPPDANGLGATWEARTIEQMLVELRGQNPKFRAILLDSEDRESIPLPLRAYEYFPLYDADGYQKLLRWVSSSAPRTPGSTRSNVRWPAALTDHVWPLAARQRELELFTRMASGNSHKRVMLLKAASSCGKTALVNAFFGYARRLGIACAHVDLK